MSTLDPKMIFEGERIVFVTGYHWVHVFRALMPLFGVVVVGSIVWSFIPNRLTSVLILLALLGSIVWVVYKILETIIKKAYVTNRRLIYRVGWTSRDTIDITLDRIGGIKMDQDYWQRFFGYGTVQVIAPLVEIILPRFLRNPIAFRNALYIKPDPAKEPADDEVATEEEARREREERDEKEALETVPLSAIEEMEAELGADLGADIGADLGSHEEASADVATVDAGDDGSNDT